MQLLIYNNHVRKVSGLQTFELAFLQNLSKEYEITYLYKISNNDEFLKKISQYAQIVKEEDNQTYFTDICIYSTVTRGDVDIKAKEYIQVIHADLKKWYEFYNPRGVGIHVAVSDALAKKTKLDYGIDCNVIPNIIPDEDIKPVLKLVTASRVEKGKGFDRMLKLAKMLKESGRLFTWEVYGMGDADIRDQFKDIKEVNFIGARDNIQSYMKRADYVVQLSDHEGFCYSIHEALKVGTPVIVTDWDGVRDSVRNRYNGYILDMELENINLDMIYNEIPKFFILDESDSVQKWRDILRF